MRILFLFLLLAGNLWAGSYDTLNVGGTGDGITYFGGLILPRPDALVAGYNFNGSALDITSNYNGSATGITYVDSKAGYKKCIQTTGSASGIDCGDINEIDGAGAITISFWLYWFDPSTSGTFDVYRKYLSSFSNLRIYSDGSYLNWRNEYSGTDTRARIIISSIAANTWTHVVYVFDGSLIGNANRLKLYLNGEYNTFNSFIDDPVPATIANSGTAHFYIVQPLSIGIACRIDQFLIYDIPLLQREIKQIYMDTMEGYIDNSTSTSDTLKF